MEQEFRVNLNILTDYLKSFECIAQFELNDALEIESWGGSSVRFRCTNGTRHPLPIPIERMIEKYLDETVPNGDRYNAWTDAEYYSYILEIDPFDRTLKLVGNYTTYGTEEVDGETILSEDNESLQSIFDYLQDYMTRSGFTNVGNNQYYVEFSGGGDSGMLEDSGTFKTGERLDVPNVIEDFCYHLLESSFGGWEINEGSSGDFVFDVASGECYLNFTWNTEEESSDTIFIKKY